MGGRTARPSPASNTTARSNLATNDVTLEPGDLCTVIGTPDVVDRFVDWAGLSQRATPRARSQEARLPSDLGLEARARRRPAARRRPRGSLRSDGDPGSAWRCRSGRRSRLRAATRRPGPRRRSDRQDGRRRRRRSATPTAGSARSTRSGFATGLALGLLLAQVTIPLPGGGEVELGVGGGPLIVALVLGTIGRTGPFTWQIPYAANLTIRQLGVSAVPRRRRHPVRRHVRGRRRHRRRTATGHRRRDRHGGDGRARDHGHDPSSCAATRSTAPE